MANITNELEDILTAILGEEVRGSIYRGLNKVNGQAERLEDVVGALNDAITAETSTNVRSFVEKVEAALYYKVGDTVAFLERSNDFFMIPGLLTTIYASGGSVNRRQFEFTVDLPRTLEPAAYPSTLTIQNLTIAEWRTASADDGPIDIVVSGALADDVVECNASIINGSNKMHFVIKMDGGASANAEVPAWFTISNLTFVTAE